MWEGLGYVSLGISVILYVLGKLSLERWKFSSCKISYLLHFALLFIVFPSYLTSHLHNRFNLNYSSVRSLHWFSTPQFSTVPSHLPCRTSPSYIMLSFPFLSSYQLFYNSLTCSTYTGIILIHFNHFTSLCWHAGSGESESEKAVLFCYRAPGDGETFIRYWELFSEERRKRVGANRPRY